MWWNGIHSRLKICRRKLAGSNPAIRTSSVTLHPVSLIMNVVGDIFHPQDTVSFSSTQVMSEQALYRVLFFIDYKMSITFAAMDTLCFASVCLII